MYEFLKAYIHREIKVEILQPVDEIYFASKNVLKINVNFMGKIH